MKREMKQKAALPPKDLRGFAGFTREIKLNYVLYLMALPGLIYYITFCYIPMYNIIIAFKDYSPVVGVFKSPWADAYGFEHFIRFFDSIFFWRVIKNTVGLSVYGILAGFWVPIVFALLLNEMRTKWYKKTVQTLTYIPHFVSAVVLCGMITDFCMKDGLINDIIVFFGGERSNLLMRPELFKTVYTLSGIWSGTGWSSIIYVAALSGIDPTLYEAAEIDGAGRMRQWRHITIPGIMPTIITLLIINIGTILSVGFEKVFLLYNPATLETAEVISTYVYNKGLVEMNYSFSTAVSLFNSVINLALVVGSNYVTNKVAKVGLW